MLKASPARYFAMKRVCFGGCFFSSFGGMAIVLLLSFTRRTRVQALAQQGKEGKAKKGKGGTAEQTVPVKAGSPDAEGPTGPAATDAEKTFQPPSAPLAPPPPAPPLIPAAPPMPPPAPPLLSSAGSVATPLVRPTASRLMFVWEGRGGGVVECISGAVMFVEYTDGGDGVKRILDGMAFRIC
jgi:hypothetical protein